MRVLHLVGGLRIGGKERVAVELCRLGRAQGHDDRILLFEHPATGGPEELSSQGVVIEPFDLPRSRLARMRRLGRRIGELQPAVVHAHNDSALFLSSAALGRRSKGTQRVATLHNMPVGLGARHRLMVRGLAARQDRVVCVSHELREARVRAGWIADAEVIPNGVDLERFQPQGPARDVRGELGVEQGTLLVGMLARFDVGKRQGDLIQAAAGLAAAGSPMALVLAGGGPLKDQVLGAVPPELPVLSLDAVADVADLLRGLDVAALISDHEGLPMSMLEAMACGTPVMGSNVGGIPELLGDPPAGHLIESGAHPIQEALKSLRDPERRAKLSAAARKRAESFSMESTAERYYGCA